MLAFALLALPASAPQPYASRMCTDLWLIRAKCLELICTCCLCSKVRLAVGSPALDSPVQQGAAPYGVDQQGAAVRSTSVHHQRAQLLVAALANLSTYYSQFLPAVNAAIAAGMAPHEKDLVRACRAGRKGRAGCFAQAYLRLKPLSNTGTDLTALSHMSLHS